jgi:NAD(P)-dependent dehydrogenase (short-subunit alcohol dehydrogenase family)
MTDQLRDKVLLTTGATGIAAATARCAGAAGARVFVVSLIEQQCAELADEISRSGGRCAWSAADVTDAARVERAVSACISQNGRIDGLFNVAGISGRRLGDGPLHECSEQGWDQTMQTNVRSVFLMSRAVLRQMLAQPIDAIGQRGVILNMASVLADSPQREQFATHAYAGSKAAIIGLSKSMAAYYAPHKIRVNAIAPGLVRTPMSRRAQEDQTILQLMHQKQPLADGLIDPDDIAATALFLLSPASRMTTGTIATVDAGWSVSG